MGGVGTTMGDIGMQIGKAAPCVGGALAGGMIGDKLTGEADGDYASQTMKNIHQQEMLQIPQLTILTNQKTYPKSSWRR